MWMRFGILIVAASMLMCISTVDASLEFDGEATRVSVKPAVVDSGGSIDARSYRSPRGLHKILVKKDDADSLAQAESSGAVDVADYESFKVMTVDESGLDGTTSSIEVRDDLNVLLLRSGAIDTTSEEQASSFVGLSREPAAFGLQSAVSSNQASDSPLRLIQFVGPIKRAWLDAVRSSGLEIVAYVPNNGYLVRGDVSARGKLMSRNRAAQARGEGFIQWEGSFLPEHKVHPALAQAASEQSGEITVAVQFALGNDRKRARGSAEVSKAKTLASSVMIDAYSVLNFTNLRMKISASRVADLAAIGSIVNIEPWTPPRLLDERSGQICASQLNADRTAPSGPGYLAWLGAHGFSSRFDFAIDVSDTGVDRGFTTADKLHPDFLDSNKQSRLVYARDYTSELDPGDVGGHGTINLSIAGGGSVSAEKGMRDAAGYNYGLGIAPFALLGASKIFQSNGVFDLVDPYTKLVSEAYRDGARVSSNSWGSASNSYSIDSQEYDARVRDAVPDQTGNQEIPILFAAGNAGPNKRISDPSSAKNVISVAASENFRKDGVDGCVVPDSAADSAMDIAYFSSGGPLDDGRIKPDITAPGTHVEGAASQNPDFDGSEVCGEAFDKPYFPAGQTLYTWSSGTSHSTPAVAGGAALVRQFLLARGDSPTAALIKALLLDTATYMTGAGAGGDLPQARQGWGLMNLNRAFDSTPKIFVNQTTTFNDSGQVFTLTGEVKDSTQPFRVMLAWTDAPGFSGAAPWVNDLDLEVSINGQTYRGNNFVGQESQPGGDADTKDNVEGVWLPAGTVGTFVVRVRASNIAGDGVPGNADATDQDFALVVYNGEKKDVPVAAITNLALTGGADAFADPGESVSMKLSIGDLSPIALAGGHGTITTTTTGVTISGGASDFPAITQGQSAEGSPAFVFSVAPNVACGSTINFVLDVTSGASLSRVPFSIRVGKSQALSLFADDVESGESKWTHGSGIKKKKNRVDTWTISSKRVHGGTSSWFTPDPGSKATDAHLDSVPIQLPTDVRGLQLVFYHTFEFERGGFDGGVIEISTGGDFEDLGAKILKGRYTGTIYDLPSNPLAARPAWIGGRLGTFQQVIVDLSSYAGKTVTIRFRIGTDDTGKGLGWYVDDVSLRGERFTCALTGSEQ